MAHTTAGWKMIAPGRLERFSASTSEPLPAGYALVEVAGCGVCHTDLGYLYGGVRTKRDPPLVLGHEISGVVVAAGARAEAWVGSRVIAAAVWPCGECPACRAGRPTACRASVMPGNDVDGGFQTHVAVPAAMLCGVGPSGPADAGGLVGSGLQLWQLGVVADAVSTPLQAIKRSGLRSLDLAVVVGAGGIGMFAVQLARATGARVVALDVDPAKLDRATALGASLALDAGRPHKEIKKAIGELARQFGLAPSGWRIFEMSGHTKGQELAWALLTQGGSISVVGYTAEPVSLRLSNLMALDATAYGSWGCDPALLPEALSRVMSGEVQLAPLVRRERLEDAPAVLEAVHRGEIKERVVLVP